MAQTQPLTNRGAKRRLRLLFTLFLVFLVWAGLQFMDQRKSLAEKKTELKNLQTDVAVVQDENEELTLEVKRLDDEEYIAQLARKYYYLSKPGEYIFITPKQEE